MEPQYPEKAASALTHSDISLSPLCSSYICGNGVSGEIKSCPGHTAAQWLRVAISVGTSPKPIVCTRTSQMFPFVTCFDSEKFKQSSVYRHKSQAFTDDKP